MALSCRGGRSLQGAQAKGAGRATTSQDPQPCPGADEAVPGALDRPQEPGLPWSLLATAGSERHQRLCQVSSQCSPSLSQGSYSKRSHGTGGPCAPPGGVPAAGLEVWEGGRVLSGLKVKWPSSEKSLGLPAARPSTATSSHHAQCVPWGWALGHRRTARALHAALPSPGRADEWQQRLCGLQRLKYLLAGCTERPPARGCYFWAPEPEES